MWHDIRYAVRGLLRAPIFTAVATLSLALAIGANATIFSLIDGMWFRPPAVRNPGNLVRIFSATPENEMGVFSFPEYQDVRDRAKSLEGVVAKGRRGATVRYEDGSSELVLVNVVSANFFSALGVTASIGRVFVPGEESRLQQQPAVVLGNSFWTRRFGADPSIVGRTITLMRDQGPILVTVSGVLPPAFRETSAGSDRDLWMPIQTWLHLSSRDEIELRRFRWFELMGRLRPGTTVERAQAEVDVLASSMAATFPDTNKGRQIRLMSDWRYRARAGGVNALALVGIVGLVVLITCVNVANLLIARTASRGREIAVRLALGIGRPRLMRQMMTESLLLGALGAAGGLAISVWLVGLIPHLFVATPGFHVPMVFEVDQRVLLATVGLTLLTTVLFGLAPSWLASRPDLTPVFKADSGAVSTRSGHRRLRGVLAAGQVAISLVLLCTAAVLTRSFLQTRTADLGFDRKPILSAWVPFGEVAPQTLDDVLARLRALPGVTDAAVAFRAPMSPSGGGMAQPVTFPGRPLTRSAPPEVRFNEVAPAYFNTLGIRTLQGRVFTDAEVATNAAVVVVSDLFARQYFPSRNAIGQLVHLGAANGRDYQIVGVVKDVVIEDIGERREPYFYVPFARQPHGELTFLVSATGDAGALAAPARNVLRKVDPRLEARIVATMGQLIEVSAQEYRLTAALVGSLGCIGLLLMLVGVYGVVAYTTTLRVRELALRMALGARRGEVVRLVLGEGVRLVVIGVAIGLPLAMLGTRALSSFLFDTRPWDGLSFAGALVVLTVAVALASVIPALRIARVDPARALREG